jgi:inorganic triphosphatase YgiF
MPTETELKLAIDPAAVAGLLRHSALRAVRSGRMRTAQLVAHYYDTADARLARDDWRAGSVRRQTLIQMLKVPRSRCGRRTAGTRRMGVALA